MSSSETGAAGGRDTGGAPREDQGRGQGSGQQAGGGDLQKEIERSGTDGAGTGGVGEGDLGGTGAAPGRKEQI